LEISTLDRAAVHRIPTKALVTPRRFDLLVKMRFFLHLRHGLDADSERVYRWHIQARSGKRLQAGLATDRWKRSLDDYVASAASLCASMACRGFLPEGAVPIDPDGELLDGSHRVACALALGVDAITAARRPDRAWAPSWGYEWFVQNGMPHDDLARLCQDWKTLSDSDDR